MNFYQKGDFVFREGNSMQGIHFIMHGAVKVATAHNGRELVVRLASDGNILGHKVRDDDKYYFNAIALKDTNICFVDAAVFTEICNSSHDFARQLLQFYALELRNMELRVVYHAQMNIREKVAEAFVYLIEKFGTNLKTKTLNIELSRKEIADIAGTTAEQVTRQLNDFEEEKLINRKRRDIQILDARGLADIVRKYKAAY